jgi:hypothetical protein
MDTNLRFGYLAVVPGCTHTNKNFFFKEKVELVSHVYLLFSKYRLILSLMKVITKFLITRSGMHAY